MYRDISLLNSADGDGNTVLLFNLMELIFRRFSQMLWPSSGKDLPPGKDLPRRYFPDDGQSIWQKRWTMSSIKLKQENSVTIFMERLVFVSTSDLFMGSAIIRRFIVAILS